MSIAVRERDVEAYLVTRLSDIGVLCLKFDPGNRVGMPDRVVLLPGGRVLWIELKTDNGHLSPVQKYRHKELRSMGHEVLVVWDKEEADRVAERIAGAVDMESAE